MNTLSRILVILYCFFSLASQAQGDSSRMAESPLVLRMQAAGKNEAIRSKQRFEQNQIERIQARNLSSLQKISQELGLVLNARYDTTRHKEKNHEIRKDLLLATAQMKESSLQEQSLRNITVSVAIMDELLIEIRKQRTEINEYTENLLTYKRAIDSIYSDSSLYLFSSDSAKAMRYLQKLSIISKNISPIEEKNEKLLLRLEELQNETDYLAFQIRTSKDVMDRYNKIRFSTITDIDTRKMKNADGSLQSFNETIRYSYEKEKRVLLYYMQAKAQSIFALLVVIAMLAGIFRYAKDHVRFETDAEALPPFLILKSSLLSAIILVLSMGQFIFVNPPFIFSFLIWMIAGIALLWLVKGYIHSFWWGLAVLVLGLCFLAGVDNLILQYSDLDRWLIFALSLIGVVLGIWALKVIKKNELREPRIRYFIYFLILCEFAAALSNLMGRWNLAKILLICGYGGMLNGVLFLWVIRLINETLQTIGILSNQTGRKFLNFSALKFGSTAPRSLYYLLVLGWLNLLARHFYTYKQITQPIQDFFTRDRTIGSYTFSIGGLIIFLVVLGSSLAISKILSLFAEDAHENTGSSNQQADRPNAGSWMLLIRIFVICVGFFLALASAGIPLDRIAIVLGGLSVGIGLGLQGLVSNLISGLILAFEKPVKVGDMVDINNKSGRMRSIGFRSSSIQLTDGSSLIIPNGDLLNQHLINWSKGNNLKKSTLVICMGFEQSVEETQKLLLEIVKQDSRILTLPPIQVNALGFQPQGIDMEIVYWTRHVREIEDLKSELIARIQAVLHEKNIALPTPSQIIKITRAGQTKDKNPEL